MIVRDNFFLTFDFVGHITNITRYNLQRERHCKGLIEPNEYTLLQMKIGTMKITSEDGLTTLQSAHVFIINLEKSKWLL